MSINEHFNLNIYLIKEKETLKNKLNESLQHLEESKLYIETLEIETKQREIQNLEYYIEFYFCFIIDPINLNFFLIKEKSRF